MGTKSETLRKQISMPQEDKDVYKHLKDQPDASKYIVKLIRADMQKQSDPAEEFRKIAVEVFEEMRKGGRQ